MADINVTELKSRLARIRETPDFKNLRTSSDARDIAQALENWQNQTPSARNIIRGILHSY